MARIALTPYALELHRSGVPEADPLDGKDALAAVDAVAAAWTEAGAVVDRAAGRVLRVIRWERSDADLRLWGVLEGGTFGEVAELYDVGTGEEVPRSASQAEMTPFYFLADFAARPALVLLQRFGALGVKMPLDEALRGALGRSEPRLTMLFGPWPAVDAARRYLRAGRLRAVRLERAAPPPGLVPGVEAEAAQLELRLALRAPVPTPVRRSLERLLSGDRPSGADDVLAALGAVDGPLAALGFQSARLEIAHDGSTRMVDLGAPGKFDVDITLDGEVELGAGGHPTFDSIHRAALRHLADLRSA